MCPSIKFVIHVLYITTLLCSIYEKIKRNEVPHYYMPISVCLIEYFHTLYVSTLCVN
jgi:hypothetical protein